MSSEIDFRSSDATAATSALQNEFLSTPPALGNLERTDSIADYTLPQLELVGQDSFNLHPEEPAGNDSPAQAIDSFPYDRAAEILTSGEFGRSQQQVIGQMAGMALNIGDAAGVVRMLDNLNQRLKEKGFSLEFDEQASREAMVNAPENVLPLRFTLRQGDQKLGTGGIDVEKPPEEEEGIDI